MQLLVISTKLVDRARSGARSSVRLLGLLAVLVSFFALPTVAIAELPAGISVDLNPSKPRFGATEPIYIEFGYTNITPNAIRFLTWGTALEGSLAADLLNVSYQGQELPYVGPLFYRLPASESDFITLQPGQRQVAVVAIESVYEIQAAGHYQIASRYGASSVSASSSFELLANRKLFKRPPVFSGCDASQQAQADAALGSAEAIAKIAQRDMRNTPVSQRPIARRYREWFGVFDAGRWNNVQSDFDKIVSATENQTINFVCTTCEPRTVAFVYPNRAFEIHLCDPFWRIRTSGSLTKGGVIVHEISHFTVVGDTFDYAYGRADSVALANNAPHNAVNNADSYLFFAENSPPFQMPTGTDPPPDPGDPGDPGDPNDPNDPNPLPEPEPEPPKPVIVPILDLLLDEVI